MKLTTRSIMATSKYINQCVLHNNQSSYTTTLLTLNSEALKKQTSNPVELAQLIAGELSQ